MIYMSSYIIMLSWLVYKNGKQILLDWNTQHYGYEIIFNP